MMPERPIERMTALLDHLAAAHYPAEGTWQCWQFARVAGGANNLLYRAINDDGAFAVKYTIRDGRDRAGREYAALVTLERVGLDVAPRAVLLERDRYPQPVVVQTWLEGDVVDTPPLTEQEWDHLLQHLLAIHSVPASTSGPHMQTAVLSMDTAEAGRERIREQVARLPRRAQPAALRELVHRIEQASLPRWPPVSQALCRCDANIRNFVRRPYRWLSVDWENSGWGDPAFEIADIMAHPTYAAVPIARRKWLATAYGRECGDATVASRIHTYYLLLLVWWVARFARSLYEVPLGLDQRLITRSVTWRAETEAKYEQYARWAQEILP